MYQPILLMAPLLSMHLFFLLIWGGGGGGPINIFLNTQAKVLYRGACGLLCYMGVWGACGLIRRFLNKGTHHPTPLFFHPMSNHNQHMMSHVVMNIHV